MSTDATYDISACRGLSRGECPHVVNAAPGLAGRIERAVAESGWPDHLRERVDGPIRHHHLLKIALAGCANGCSRPQIADVGIIASRRPAISYMECTGCGLCAQTCPDGAIRMQDGEPVVDEERCQGCTVCERACPAWAIGGDERGVRVMLGGRLGRRPRLAEELPGLRGEAEAVRTIERAIRFLMREGGEGRRLGDLLAEPGAMERLEAS
jgi:dissimilatory sulfite reductase (desulfoviridin) alpha/beta subunit